MAYDRISVRAIIQESNKIFLVKHLEKSNFRSLPGGGMDPGEDAKQALQREITEELGCECTIGKLMFVQEFWDERRKMNIFEMFFSASPMVNLETNAHLGTSHAYEIFKSDRVEVGTVTLLPSFLDNELSNPTGQVFFSDMK